MTGHVFKLPYTLHAEQYMRAPLMFWQSSHEPSRVEAEPLNTFHNQLELEEYHKQCSFEGYLRQTRIKAIILFRTYTFAHWLDAPLIAGLFFWRRAQAVRWSWSISLLLICVLFSSTPWLRWNYVAPLMGLLAAAIVTGLRGVSAIRVRSYPVGIVIAVVYVTAFFGTSAVWAWQHDAAPVLPLIEFRQALLTQLQRVGGQHLVLVKYDPQQLPSLDLVFNPADIDAAPVVFARDLGSAKNRELLDYYRQRRVYIIDPGSLRLRPYSFGGQ